MVEMNSGRDERERIQLKIRYRENLGFLVKSAHAFDSGDHSEASRMATAVRTLTYDGGNGRSILAQIEAKPRIKWRSFYTPFAFEAEEETRMIGSSLHGSVIEPNGFSHEEHLDFGAEGRSVSYDEWWQVEPVVEFGDGHTTRQQLVLGLANQDGGAHVDLDGKHITALLAASPRLAQNDGADVPEEMQLAFQRDLLQIQMRTVANEVLHSITNAQKAGLI
ncbi:hypothetical protein [Cryobacterium sp. M15]|uniref:hypothetical protein n=1 Tax=Cryobacterium sp. M15 TaxID=2048291 RepID=UPI0011B002BF|nr:hypothetical protein [Cryobacterium sp. M15]